MQYIKNIIMCIRSISLFFYRSFSIYSRMLYSGSYTRDTGAFCSKKSGLGASSLWR